MNTKPQAMTLEWEEPIGRHQGQYSAGPKDSPHFIKRSSFVVDVFKHLVHEHSVERVVVKQRLGRCYLEPQGWYIVAPLPRRTDAFRLYVRTYYG